MTCIVRLLIWMMVSISSYELLAQSLPGSAFVCPPCGSTCDHLSFEKAGLCPQCQMKLVSKSVLESYQKAIATFKVDSTNSAYFNSILPRKTLFKTLKGKSIESGKLDAFLKQQMHVLQIPALSIAILNQGQLVYYQALGYKTIETKDSCNLKTLFEAASMTKTMFAYLVVKLARESIINLDKPLYEYLPNPDLSADNSYKQITARMILSHTSGLPNWRTGQLKIEAPPGTTYIYSGEGYEYLGRVIEHILHKELNDIYLERVIGPLGLKHSFFVESGYVNYYMASGYQNGKLSGRDISFEAHTAYGLRTNAIDYSKFISHLTRDEIFPLMTSGQIKISSTKSVGLGLFKEITENGTKYYHTGNNSDRFTGRFEIYPDQQFASIVLMNCGKEEEFSKALNKFLTR